MLQTRWSVLVSLLVVLGVGSCGGEPEQPPPQPQPTSGGTAPQPPPPQPMPTPPPPPIARFPDSPITGFATQMTLGALAAYQGQQIPPLPIPIDGGGAGAQVSFAGAEHPTGQIAVVGFFMEIDVTFQPPPRWRQPDPPGLALGLWVGPTGMRVMRFRPRTRPGVALPPSMLDVQNAVAGVVDASRAGTIQPMLIGVAELQALGDPTHWMVQHAAEELQADMAAIETTRRYIQPASVIISYRLNQLGVAVQDEQHTLFGLMMNADTTPEGGLILRSPLVLVRGPHQ